LVLSGTAAILGGGADLPPHRGGLHLRAQRKGLFYGAAVDQVSLRDPLLVPHVLAECGMLVPKDSFTWAIVHPRPDRFSFERAEIMLAFAGRHGLRVRGRSLLSHRANPDWLDQTLTSQNAEKLLTTHIRDVVGRFRRRVGEWDVVDEAIAPEEGGLRRSAWFRALGPRYIDLAFHACAAADPHAGLVLNESGLEYATPEQERRRGAMLTLLADLRARGVPVQALGLQAHLTAAEYRLDQKVLANFCRDVAGLGLQIVITEMDIRDNDLPADVATRDHAIAAHGRAFLEAMLPDPALAGIVTWGLSDRRQWLDETMPRIDQLPQRPLPLDAEMRRKPLWYAMAAALDTAPAKQVGTNG